MRFGAKQARQADWRQLPAHVIGAGVGALALATAAFADIVITPILSIEQVFTDNVRAQGDDRDADGVTVLTGAVRALLTTSRINAVADVNLYYNEFWATNTLDNLNGGGLVAGRVEVLENFFFVDGIASKQDVYLSPNDISASGLTTGQGTLQQENFAVRPFIRTQILGIADLLVAGNYGQVQFDKPVVGVAATTLTDITVKQAGAKITTGERSSLYELIATAEYLETDQGFEQRNVVGGAILKLTPNIAAIGRIGYEKIFDPSFPEIRGTVWSVGGRYTFNKDSTIQFEVGRRFEDNSYRGELNLALSPFIRAVGAYTDTLTPVQLTLVRNVDDLLDQEGNFQIDPPNAPSIPDPLLLDTIVRDKEMRLATVYTKDLQSVSLLGGYTERYYPSLNDDESFYFFGLQMQEQLSRQLEYTLNARFQDNYQTLATGTPSEIYSAEFAVAYQWNTYLTLTGGYAYRLEQAPGDLDTYENILRFGASQRF
jgi:hypothetical protein